MTEWKPIESAPKDGTMVLLAGVAHGGTTIGKFWPDEDMHGRRAGWIASLGSEGWFGNVDPTAWQPLPAPPPPSGDR